MLTSRADGRDVADEEGRDLAGQPRGPGDGAPGGRIDPAAEDADPRAPPVPLEVPVEHRVERGYDFFFTQVDTERVVKRSLIVAGLMEVRFRQFVTSAEAPLR